MLLHELSCPKGRLLLGVLMLKDTGRNCYAVPGVDQVVSYESRRLAEYTVSRTPRITAEPRSNRLGGLTLPFLPSSGIRLIVLHE